MVQEIWLKLTVTWTVLIKYIQLLKDNLIPDLAEGEIFHFDGTSSNRSCTIQQILADESVTVLKDWPATSLDLNIIKQMWTELKRKVHLKNPHKIEVLNEPQSIS